MFYGKDKPITIWGWQEQLIKKAMDAYTERTGETLSYTVEDVPYSELPEIFGNRLESNYPNIMLVHDQDIKKFIQSYPVVFKNINVIAKNELHELNTELFTTSKVTNISSFNGSVFAVPVSCEPVALFYNKSYAEEMGFSLSEEPTWEELTYIAEQLKAENKYLMPFDNTLLQTMMQSTGRLFYDSEKNIEQGDALEVLQVLKPFLKNGYLYQRGTQDTSEIYAKLCENEIFCIIGSTYAFSQIKKLMLSTGTAFEWGVCKIPKSGALQYNVDLGGYSCMICNKGSNEENHYVYDFLINAFANAEETLKDASYQPYSSMAELDMLTADTTFHNSLTQLDDSDYFGETKVLHYLSTLLSDIPEIYYGKCFFQILQCMKDTLLKLVSQDNYTIEDAEQSIESCLAGIREDDPPGILTGIIIESYATKQQYYKYESFDGYGLVVRAYYSDGYSQIISDYTYDSGLLYPDMNHILIEYCGATAEHSITVTDRTITGLSVATHRPFLQGNTLEESDFWVYAVYNAGDNRIVDGFTFSACDLSTLGEKTVNFSYTEDGITITTSITITVVKKLVSLSIVNQPNKKTYNDGELFKIDGITAEATYSDGSIGIIPYNKLSYDKCVKIEKGKDDTTFTITYYENGASAKASITLYKKFGPETDDTAVSQDMGVCGKGQINLGTGELSYKFEDFYGGDSVTPIAISRIYKKRFAEDCFVGNDWRLNIQQELYFKDEKWIYIDKEGKEQVFTDGFEEKPERSAIRCEKLGLDLFKISEEKINLVDRSNNTLVFTKIAGCYRLTEAHALPSTPKKPVKNFMVEIEYSDGKISVVKGGKITDGKRHTVYFDYDDNTNLLNKLYYEYDKKTLVVSYEYDGNQLVSITKQHSGIAESYSAKTEFTYSDTNFVVKDCTLENSQCTSENSQCKCKKLTYNFNDDKVSEFTVGYGDNTIESTTFNYSASRTSAEAATEETPPEETTQKPTSPKITSSTYAIYKNTLSAVAFNSMGVVSKYSFDFEKDGNTCNYDKIIKVNGAQSRNFDYMALANSYSDTLDLYHDDFSNNKDWTGGSITNEKYVCGSSSLRGKTLKRTFDLSNEKINDKTTVYLSMWIHVANGDHTNSLTIKIVHGKEETLLTHKLDKRLGLWQFTAFCLGQRNVGDKVTVILSSESLIYVDDVRLTKAPYETPDDIPNPVYDDCGCLRESSSFNPGSKRIDKVCYDYNNHRPVEKRVLSGSVVIQKIHYAYDNNGMISSEKNYASNLENYISENYSYDGYTLISTTDQNGIKTNISEGVDWSQSSVIGEIGSPDVTEKSVYYDNSAVVKELQSGSSKNAYTYSKNGAMQQAQFSYNSANKAFDSTIGFEYDSFGNLHKVNIGDTSLITFTNDEKHLNSVTYANGDSETYAYDDKDRLVSVTVNDETTPTTITYSDLSDEKVTITHPDGLVYESEKLNKDGKTTQSKVKFEGVDSILKVVGKAISEAGNVTTTDIYLSETASTPFESRSTILDPKGRLQYISRVREVGAKNSPCCSFGYDGYNHLAKRLSSYLVVDEITEFTSNYSYAGTKNGTQGTLIESETFKIGEQEKESIKYEYYKNGNIKNVKEKKLSNDGEVTYNTLYRYEYDEYNRLIWEYNSTLSKAYNFAYDGNGNITEKKTYEYANGTIGSLLTTDRYNYPTPTDSPWHDQLKSYNDIVITYDDSGNPTNYLGKTMTWTGRLLKKVDDTTMSYDINGLRTVKGNRHYYWHNGNLIMERWMTGDTKNYIYYYYDTSGVCGFNYNGLEYYYKKNIFGDILAIYSSNGVLECYYQYDAWGNHKTFNNYAIQIYDSATDSTPLGFELHIGNVNPIRYRSYYWDQEFCLYYLQTRYYDPLLGRFISPDSVDYLDPESILGLNLYAYCGDNPVMCVDPSGHFAISLIIAMAIGAAIGGVLSAGTSIVQQLASNNGDWTKLNVGKIFFDGAFGAINGALAASGICLGWSIAISAGLGFASSVGNDLLFEHGNVDWGNAFLSAAIGAFTGAIAGAGANNVKSGMQVSKFINSRNILNRTVANGTKKAIARQTNALMVHAKQLIISGARYLTANMFNMILTFE